MKIGLITVVHVLKQVKAIEKKDAVLTNKQQIDRLLRPGATYFNLNPFEVSAIHTWQSRCDTERNVSAPRVCDAFT